MLSGESFSFLDVMLFSYIQCECVWVCFCIFLWLKVFNDFFYGDVLLNSPHSNKLLCCCPKCNICHVQYLLACYFKPLIISIFYNNPTCHASPRSTVIPYLSSTPFLHLLLLMLSVFCTLILSYLLFVNLCTYV